MGVFISENLASLRKKKFWRSEIGNWGVFPVNHLWWGWQTRSPILTSLQLLNKNESLSESLVLFLTCFFVCLFVWLVFWVFLFLFCLVCFVLFLFCFLTSAPLGQWTGKPQLQFTDCSMKNTHSTGIPTSPSSLFIQESSAHVKHEHCRIFCLVLFCFFSLEGGNIYSGSTCTIPGSGFDTVSCKNRNHNKLGAHLRGTGLLG